MLGYGQFIKPEGITALQNFKYKPGTYTFFDN